MKEGRLAIVTLPQSCDLVVDLEAKPGRAGLFFPGTGVE
jgi:hypothetical protein